MKKLFKLVSYIKKPNMEVDNLSRLNEIPDAYFVKLDDEESLEQIANDMDLDYIEGVIYFEYNDLVLMDFTYWDIIDQLWAYIINLIEEYTEGQKAEVYFPDQPIKLALSTINKSLVLFTIESVNNIQVPLPKQEFFQFLLESGETFFKRLQDYFKGDVDYSHELGKITKLKKWYIE